MAGPALKPLSRPFGRAERQVRAAMRAGSRRLAAATRCRRRYRKAGARDGDNRSANITPRDEASRREPSR